MTPAPLHDRRRTSGFTLIEVTIALTIFTIAMLSLSSMQLQAIGGNNRGRHSSRAASIAQTQLEDFQQLAWSQLTTTTGWSTPVPDTTVVEGENGNSVEMAYSVDWRITDLVVGWTRSVDVRVTWSDPKRPNRTVIFSTIRFNHEGA